MPCGQTRAPESHGETATCTLGMSSFETQVWHGPACEGLTLALTAVAFVAVDFFGGIIPTKALSLSLSQ
jgi:hypothetical protein